MQYLIVTATTWSLNLHTDNADKAHDYYMFLCLCFTTQTLITV